MKSIRSAAAGVSLCIAVSAALKLPVVPVAEAQEFALEEVVVVARRRVETLQETPVAVSAFGSDALKEAQIENLGDLTRHVPGLNRREGRKEGDLSIRGIGTSTAGANIDPGVGVYVDNVFIPRSDSQLIDVINTESVQVLRGPQGTLFGKNTAGGALLITTQKPGEEYTGSIRVNLGNFDRQLFRGSVSGPLVGGLSAGLTVDLQSEEGYMEDLETGRDYGNKDRRSAVLQLHYEGDAGFFGDLLMFYGKVEENAAPATCKLGQASGILQNFTAPGDARDYRTLCADSERLARRDKVLSDRQDLPWEMTNKMVGLTLGWDIGDHQLKSITGYLQQEDILQSGDTDSSPIFVINNRVEANRHLQASGIDNGDEERTFISQEFQFLGDALDGFLGYNTGVFVSREEIDGTPSGVAIGPGGYIGQLRSDGDIATLPPGTAGFGGLQSSDFENKSWAVFGQAILNFNDVWQLTLGARYTEEEKKAYQTNYVSQSPGMGILSREGFDALASFEQDVVINPESPSARGDDSWEVFSPAVTLTAFMPETWSNGTLSSGMLYVSVSEGFKAGGFTPLGESFLPFDPEDILSYEFGAKLDFLDHRLRINTSVYYTEYDDIQLRVTRTLDEFTTVNGIINAANATISGAELELSYLPVDSLLLAMTASYIEPEYDAFEDEDRDGNVIDRSDNPFSYIPDSSYSLTAQHTLKLGLGTVVSRLNGFYRDEVYVGLDAGAATDPAAFLDDYWLWNFRIAFTPASVQGLEIAAYTNNFLDEEYVATGNLSSGGIGAASLIYGKPRSYGLDIRYSW